MITALVKAKTQTKNIISNTDFVVKSDLKVILYFIRRNRSIPIRAIVYADKCTKNAAINCDITFTVQLVLKITTINKVSTSKANNKSDTLK